jgi:exopolysaccharide biosynthesis protein
MEKRKRANMKHVFPVLAGLFVVAVCIVVFHSVWTTKPPSTAPAIPITPTDEGTSPKTHTQEMIFNSVPYAFEVFEIADVTKVRLIANFKEKRTTKQIMEEHRCLFAVNAGFYSTANTPLGLFIGENYPQTKAIPSALFNGYVSVTNGKASISSRPPDNTTDIAVQTGPLLFVNGEPQLLSIQNDSHERRIIVGLSRDGHMVFIVLFIKDSLYQGPLLEDLPQLIEKINPLLPSPLYSAINLDGGTASAFISPSTSIQELTSVGSVFCLIK